MTTPALSVGDRVRVHSRYCVGYVDAIDGQEGIVRRLVPVRARERDRIDVYVETDPEAYDPFVRGFWREAQDLDKVPA